MMMKKLDEGLLRSGADVSLPLPSAMPGLLSDERCQVDELHLITLAGAVRLAQ